MADNVGRARRSWVMSRVRGRNTAPELYVRSELHKAGFRFRVNVASMPGSPDIVLPKYRTVILVHGCFWHWHGCARSRMPVTNRRYWREKIKRNVDRDKVVFATLKDLGWQVRLIWECEIRAAVPQLLKVLRRKRKAGRPTSLG